MVTPVPLEHGYADEVVPLVFPVLSDTTLCFTTSTFLKGGIHNKKRTRRLHDCDNLDSHRFYFRRHGFAAVLQKAVSGSPLPLNPATPAVSID